MDMGTSSILYVMFGGIFVISSATSHDGGPRRDGKEIMAFLSNPKNTDQLRFVARTCFDMFDHLVSSEYFRKAPSGCVVSSTVSGAGFLEEMVMDPACDLEVSEAPQDMRMMDWAYVIDLDNNTLEVFRGMNRTPLDKWELFYDGEEPDSDGYYPFKAVDSFDLRDPPSYRDFISACEVG